MKRYEDLQEDAAPILTILTDPAVIAALKQDKLINLSLLESQHEFKPVVMLPTLYEFALFKFSVGDYAGAKDLLYHFRILVTYICLNFVLFFTYYFHIYTSLLTMI